MSKIIKYCVTSFMDDPNTNLILFFLAGNMARKFVYFDILTTNFGPTAEIVQIGAVGSSKFESILLIINDVTINE